MEPPNGPAHEGWKLVGEEPYDDARLAELRSRIEANGPKVRWWRVAAIANTLFLVLGPLLIGVTFEAPIFRWIDIGLQFAIPVEVFAVLFWWGYSSTIKFDLELERGGGYWVYAPIEDEVVEGWVDQEGGVLGPDGYWRNAKRIVKP